jgi:hypothetical protein
MQPTLMIEHPFQGCVWVCLNGCTSIIEGDGDEVDHDDARVLVIIAQSLVL